jgi:E3 ubiquitin-protein ligase listerin
MCHLVTDTSNDVQKMAYQMLQEAAKKHTEYVVVEAAVDSEGAYQARLPAELLDILTQTVDIHEDSVEVRVLTLIQYIYTHHLCRLLLDIYLDGL